MLVQYHLLQFKREYSVKAVETDHQKRSIQTHSAEAELKRVKNKLIYVAEMKSGMCQHTVSPLLPPTLSLSAPFHSFFLLSPSSSPFSSLVVC